MKKKQVWKYYCDYCKKSGGSKYHIEKHEKGCTLNPNRVCGLCKIVGNKQSPIETLIAILPNIENYRSTVIDRYGFKSEYYDDFDTVLHGKLDILRETVDNCPACIMAALRQAKIPVPMVIGFNYKEELDTFWKEQNKEEIEIY
jgi:hypothetical protein